MKITVYSIMMALICGTILLIIMHIIRKRHLYSRKLGFQCVTFFYLLCGLRLFIPVSFPFTTGYDFKGVYATFFESIYWNKYPILNEKLSIFDGLLILWGCVATILLFRFFFQYLAISKSIHLLPQRTDQQCINTMETIFDFSDNRMQVSIKKSKEFQIPVTIGLVNKFIILPDKDYTNKELYYILLHEYTHILNHDLWVKMLLHILCCIMWWNPATYYLRKDLSQTLEMKCDTCITEKLSNKATADYLNIIVATLKNYKKGSPILGKYGAAALAVSPNNEMLERFQVVYESKQRRLENKHVWVGIIIILIIASYLVIPRGVYEPPANEIVTQQNTIEVTPNNTFIIKDADGNYYYSVNNQYQEIISKETAMMMIMEDGFQLMEK